MLRFFRYFLGIIIVGVSVSVNAQCPEFFDGTGVPAQNPYWVHCFGNNFTLNLQSPDNIGAWTVDWGDGSPVENGPDLIPPAFIQHTYTATIDTFVVTFEETATGCIIQGVVVMEEPTNASIQIPLGGVTQVCAPAIIEFDNSSTDVSTTTVFTWDFGDGTPPAVFDHTNAGQTVQHQYLPGTVNCNTQVTLTAENYCNTAQGGPSTATFNPIQVWDVDDAAIDASDILLCYPDTTVAFTNITDRNCFAQGNTFQRQEFWNFGDYWGVGTDSTVGWTPWPPALPITIAYPGIGTYDVMLVDSSFCGLDTAYITVQIVPPPTALFTISDDTICAGDAITAFNMSAGGANDFSWNFGDGGGWQNTGGGNQTNTFNTPGDYTIFLVANIAGGTAACTDTFQLDLHVLPSPTSGITTPGAVGCDTLTVPFSDASVNAVNWFWDFDNGFTSTSQNPPVQFYNSPGNYNVSLTVTSNNGCVDVSNTTVNVYESPTVAFVPTSVCMNTQSQFTDNSTSAPGDPIINWDWDFGDGGNSTQQNPVHTYASMGTFDIILEVATANCTNADTVPVIVEPIPTAGFTMNPTDGCTPLLVDFTNTTAGATGGFEWSFGDGNTSTQTDPSHLFVNSSPNDTLFTIQLVASTTFGCTDTVTDQVTVFAGAQADFSHNGFPGCAPLPVDFTNLSTGATSYQWDFDDGMGSTATDPSHQYVNPTLFIEIFDVELIAFSPNGCSDTATQSITVYPEPDFGFTSVPDSGCSPLSVTFPAVVGAVSYDWDFGDGNTDTGPTPTHVYSNTTINDQSYTVTLIALNAFGCADTSMGSVLVFPNPTADFTVDVTDGCTPLDVEIQNNSTSADAFSWDYGDGATSATIQAVHTHTYNNPTNVTQTYDLELIASTTRGCADTAFETITVYPAVTSNFTQNTLSGCSPLNVNFTNLSSGTISSYAWNFGDGSIGNGVNEQHQFTYNGTTDTIYTVELIVFSPDGCSDTSTVDIQVFPKPFAGFNVNAINGCTPFIAEFQNISVGADSYSWDYGNGNTSDTQALLHEEVYTIFVPSPQSFTVELIVETLNGCSDTATQVIEVYPSVTAQFTSDTIGCSPFPVDFTEQSSGSVSSFDWDFGDGSADVQQNPQHTFFYNGTTDTTYLVELIVTSIYGCTDTAYGNVTVLPDPQAMFLATPVSQTYPDTTVNIANNTGQGPWQYEWDFGDGNTSNLQNPGVHDYTGWGTFDIMLIVSTPYCSDTAMQNIEIIPPLPVPDFIGSGEGCQPLTISFVNTSLYADSYIWQFGDGGTSNQVNPTYTYTIPGTYSVELIATGPGGVQSTVKVDSVIVHERANAFFTFTPAVVFVPSNPVQFYNLSSFADSYEWDLGDGTNSVAFEPVHSYTSAGFFNVTLIANNQWNCPDTLTISNAIEGKEGGDAIFPNAFTPNPNGPSGGAYDPNSFNNDVFFPVFEGVEDYHLMIFNRWGELIFESFDPNIGWDGYYRDQLCQQDVYVWKVRAEFTDGRVLDQVGDVTLLR